MTARSVREAELRLRRVVEANDALAAAKEGNTAIVCVARHRLQDAVDAARDAGVDWAWIADALGTTRGATYQRFRQRGKRTNR